MILSISDLYGRINYGETLIDDRTPLKVLSARTGKVLIRDARKCSTNLLNLGISGIRAVINVDKDGRFAQAGLVGWAYEHEYKKLKET